MRRRLTRRQKNKRNKQIIMFSTICLLVVMGVGYAAFQTNLTLKAKGNIKCSGTIAKDLLLKEVINSGDGLYQDEYEPNRYLYKGASPKNYITFNNELWRIISVEEDGTIKIIKNENIGIMVWDETGGEINEDTGEKRGSNEWDRPSDLKTYLNNEYLNSINKNFEKIIYKTWSIGEVTYINSDLNAQIISEKSKVSQEAKIGLVTVSEYLRANTNKEQCKNFYLNNINVNTCSLTNWMIFDHSFWTISPIGTFQVFSIGPNGYIARNNVTAWPGVNPVVYLSSDIKLCGTGTQQDPYIIPN